SPQGSADGAECPSDSVMGGGVVETFIEMGGGDGGDIARNGRVRDLPGAVRNVGRDDLWPRGDGRVTPLLAPGGEGAHGGGVGASRFGGAAADEEGADAPGILEADRCRTGRSQLDSSVHELSLNGTGAR